MIPSATQFDVRRYGGDVAEHAHPHHQLVLPLTGIMEMEAGGNRAEVRGHRAAAIPAGMAHRFSGSADNAFLIVDLPTGENRAEGMATPFWSRAADMPFVPVDPALAGFCAFVAGQLDGGPAGQGLHGIRAQVAGQMIVDALAVGAGIETPPLSRHLARATAFVDAHLEAPISVADVARAAGVGVSRLHALFDAGLGISPKRYIARERLERAALMLEETDLSVAEIALRAGYGDQSAFARAFHRHLGCPPAAYRGRNRRQ